MLKKANIKKEMRLPKWYTVMIILVILATAGLVAYVLHERSVWPEYNSAVNECGQQPIVGQGYSKDYYRPGDKGYDVPGTGIYFCSESAAKAAGYRLPASIEKRY